MGDWVWATSRGVERSVPYLIARRMSFWIDTTVVYAHLLAEVEDKEEVVATRGDGGDRRCGKQRGLWLCKALLVVTGRQRTRWIDHTGRNIACIKIASQSENNTIFQDIAREPMAKRFRSRRWASRWIAKEKLRLAGVKCQRKKQESGAWSGNSCRGEQHRYSCGRGPTGWRAERRANEEQSEE